MGKKLNKKDLLSSNLATKKGYCTQLRAISNKCITNLYNKLNTNNLINKFAQYFKNNYICTMIRETKKIQVGSYIETLVKYEPMQRLKYPMPAYRKNYGWALKKVEKIEKSTDI